LASRLYGTARLSAVDTHTVAMRTVKGVTYVPIPAADGKTFAGLLTVDLPLGVKAGQEFNIVVRRISTQTVTEVIIQKNGRKARGSDSNTKTWRYVTGAFQIKIPVTTEGLLLGSEENTLAIMKARLAVMSPSYRWYPVLKRYLDYVSARVDGCGGNASAVPPSLQGVPPKGHGKCEHHAGNDCKHIGKIAGLIFDRFGDFEGFFLETEDGEAKFFSREKDIAILAERAWRERLRITVWSTDEDTHRPRRVVVHTPPVAF
jgi:hypothetical protein